MSTIDFPVFDDWFEDEVPVIMIDFVKQVMEIQEHASKQIYDLRKNDFDESVLERMIRDIRASAFSMIESSIEIFLLLGG